MLVFNFEGVGEQIRFFKICSTVFVFDCDGCHVARIVFINEAVRSIEGRNVACCFVWKH